MVDVEDLKRQLTIEKAILAELATHTDDGFSYSGDLSIHPHCDEAIELRIQLLQSLIAKRESPPKGRKLELIR